MNPSPVVYVCGGGSHTSSEELNERITGWEVIRWEVNEPEQVKEEKPLRGEICLGSTNIKRKKSRERWGAVATASGGAIVILLFVMVGLRERERENLKNFF